jgi:hypothetical protein
MRRFIAFSGQPKHIALVELASADSRKLPDGEFVRLYRAMG